MSIEDEIAKLTPAGMAKPSLIVSGVCTCNRCGPAKSIYRMIGKCHNCGTEPILMLFRPGDKTATLECPVCGVGRSRWDPGVKAKRLARPDEIPVDFEEASHE